MAKPRGENKASVGGRIVRRLQRFAEALENREVIADRFTCRRVSLDLNPTHYDGEKVKATREILGVSQALFARFLGVSVKTVRSWEQGVNQPQDIACRFLDEIRFNPEYWSQRLQDVAKVNKSSGRKRPPRPISSN